MIVPTKAVVLVAAFAVAATSALLVQGALSGPAAAAPTPSDVAFIVANQQSNLAEISLGPLGMSRGQDDATKHLADMTRSDHITAKSKLASAANAVNATLPSAPNALQLTVAKQLKAAATDSFDLMYAQAQVAAHKQALAGARLEQSTGLLSVRLTSLTRIEGPREGCCCAEEVSAGVQA